MQRILLLGYFGAGNFGDDALLSGWLATHGQWMKDQQLVADITVCGETPPTGGFVESPELSELISDLIPRDQVLKNPVSDYRALIVPGGSLLQDETSLKSLIFYLWVIREFLVAGKPVYLLNQGIGPLHAWLSRFLTPRYLQNTSQLSFRDRDSYEWARNQPLLANHPALYLVCDPMLDPPFSGLDLNGLDLNLPDEYALFIPRPTGDLPYPGDETTEPRALVTLIQAVVEASGLEPALLPLHPGQDLEFCHEIKALCNECRIIDPAASSEHYNSAMLSIIAGAKMVISHRLHGLVTAVAHGVPIVGVAYDPKVISFCEEVGYPYCFPATAHNDSSVEDVKRLWDQREESIESANRTREGMVARLKTAQEQFYDLW